MYDQPRAFTGGLNTVDLGHIGGEQYVGKPLNVGARFRMRFLNGFLACDQFIIHNRHVFRRMF